MKHFHLNSAIIGALVGIAILLVARPLTNPGGSAEDALIEADRAFAAMSVSEGAKAAWGSFMTEDAMIMGAGSQPTLGLDDILADFEDWPAGASISWEPKRAEVAASGEMGWTWGRYILTIPGAGDDDAPKVSHGKYLNIWEKQPDGAWKVLVDVGNSNPAPEEGE